MTILFSFFVAPATLILEGEHLWIQSIISGSDIYYLLLVNPHCPEVTENSLA
jgi:hypothetical protein